jgi:hypothetical protein
MPKIDINAKVPQYLPRRQVIPAEAALQKDKSDIETKNYLISFASYKENMCQIQDLNTSCARKLLTILRNIGNKCTSYKDLSQIGLNMKPVGNQGEYNGLYKNLTEDVELFEHYLSEDARLFYFVSPVMLFEVVAIRNKHFRTDKNK